MGKGSVEGPRPSSFRGPSQVKPPTKEAPQSPYCWGWLGLIAIQPKMIQTYLGIGTISTRPIPSKFSRLLPSRMRFLSIALCQTRRDPQHLVNRSMGEKKNGAVTEMVSSQRMALFLHHFSATINVEAKRRSGSQRTRRNYLQPAWVRHEIPSLALFIEIKCGSVEGILNFC